MWLGSTENLTARVGDVTITITDDKVYEVVVNGYFAKVETVAEETLVEPFRTRLSAESYQTGYRLATEKLAQQVRQEGS